MHTEVVLAKHLASDAPISSLISFLIHLSFDLYMDFGHAGFVDARQCTFNQVGRDQIYNRTQYYISISPSAHDKGHIASPTIYRSHDGLKEVM